MPYDPGNSFALSVPYAGDAADLSGKLRRNGADADPAVPVAFADRGDATKVASGTVPAGWSVGDAVELIVFAIDATVPLVIDLGRLGTSAAPVGDHLLTVAVTDDADDSPLEARVSIRASGSRYHVGLTDDATGEIEVPVDDGTYTALAVLPGYTAAAASVAVDGADASVAIAMTRTLPRPSDGDHTTLLLDVIRNGQPVGAGKKVWVRLVGDEGEPDPIGVAEKAETTDAASQVKVEVLRGGVYDILELAVREGVSYTELVDSFEVDDADLMTRKVEVFFE